MKKVFFSVLVFFFNVLPIYAFSFEMDATVSKTVVSPGEKINIDVSLNNINDTVSGIASCELKLSFDDGITLNGKITTYGNWQFISGVRGYSFDTMDSVLTNTKIFTIPVVVNKTGKVRITDIICTDIDDRQYEDEEEVITFSVVSQSSSSNQSSSSSSKPSSSSSSKPSSSSASSSSKPSSSSSSSSKPSSSSQSASSSKPSSSSSSKPSSSSSSSVSNASSSNDQSTTGGTGADVYLADIKVNGGKITFKRDVFEYGIVTQDLSSFSVEPVVENETDTYDVSESFADDTKTFVITVWNAEDDMQKYILYVVEGSPQSSGSVITVEEKEDYSGFFKAVIVVLVLVNLGRIGYKMYKDELKKF